MHVNHIIGSRTSKGSSNARRIQTRARSDRASTQGADIKASATPNDGTKVVRDIVNGISGGVVASVMVSGSFSSTFYQRSLLATIPSRWLGTIYPALGDKLRIDIGL